MTFEDVRKEIVGAVQEASGAFSDPRFVRAMGDPELDIRFEELDLDSLSAMDLCVEIEGRTGVEVDLGQLAQHPSINALSRALATKPGVV